MNTEYTRLSTMRLYGSSIAMVSGSYSMYLATTGVGMTTAAWGMLVLGLIVLVHGVVLLTPAASTIGAASGPLMIGYAILMLVNQAWMSAGGWTGTDTAGMNDGMMTQPMTTGMGADPGMVAIAVLMLASGLIMTVRREMMTP